MVAVGVALVFLLLRAAASLPVLSDMPEVLEMARSLAFPPNPMARLDPAANPLLLSQDELRLLLGDNQVILEPSKGRDWVRPSKRNEGKIPAMGLGVLSDMRNFFDELRTNLDSVEEVAALSKEQGLFRSGKIKPADFLELIAKHGSRMNKGKTVGQRAAPKQAKASQLLFGPMGTDGPYKHTGLGK